MNVPLPTRPDFVSVEDYLSGEPLSEVRHEYLGGIVYAMAGASRRHGRISGNIFAALHSHLRGRKCDVSMNDMKVRIAPLPGDRYYYPDVLVACDPDEPSEYYCEKPLVIFEVLSPETARIDREEKYLAYSRLPSLRAYVLVDQAKLDVQVHHFDGAGGERVENLAAPEEVLRLEALDFALTLGRLYEDVF